MEISNGIERYLTPDCTINMTGISTFFFLGEEQSQLLKTTINQV